MSSIPTLPMPRGSSSRIAGVFAHPDDEAFFAGATLAGYAAAGCEVRLATLTGGEVFGPAQLEKYARAAAALGATDARRLRPGAWQDLGRAGAPGSLAAAPLGEVVSAVRQFLAEASPDVLIINDAGGVTGHLDHVRAHRALMAARGSIPVVLAGCVRAADVGTATRLLTDLAPGRPIGSGGIRGVEDGDLIEHVPPLSARKSRAAALDLYYPGLGSRPLADLVDPATGVGDGVVLRAIAEAAGHREFFRRM